MNENYSALVSGSKGLSAMCLTLIAMWIMRGMTTHMWNLDVTTQQAIAALIPSLVMGLYEGLTNFLKQKYGIDLGGKWTH